MKLQERAVNVAERHEAEGYHGAYVDLFNPSNQFVMGEFNGNKYPLAPSGWAYNVGSQSEEEHDGVTRIIDQYGVTVKNDMDGNTIVSHNQKLHDAKVIAEHIVEHFARRGIVRLTGNARQDDVIKVRAEARWNAYQHVVCEEILKTRADQLEVFHRNPMNKDRVPPAPSPLVRMATQFIQRQSTKGVRRMKHVCLKCGYDTNANGDFLQHLTAFTACRDVAARAGTIQVDANRNVTFLAEGAPAVALPPDEDDVPSTEGIPSTPGAPIGSERTQFKKKAANATP